MDRALRTYDASRALFSARLHRHRALHARPGRIPARCGNGIRTPAHSLPLKNRTFTPSHRLDPTPETKLFALGASKA